MTDRVRHSPKNNPHGVHISYAARILEDTDSGPTQASNTFVPKTMEYHNEMCAV